MREGPKVGSVEPARANATADKAIAMRFCFTTHKTHILSAESKSFCSPARASLRMRFLC